MSKPPFDALFLAPGSGLGHLTRTGAIALALNNLSIESLIATTSSLGQMFARNTGISVRGIPGKYWSRDLPNLIKEVKPKVVILDTFPFGFRKKDREPENLDKSHSYNYVYLARVIKTKALEEICPWDTQSPRVENVIAVEPLTNSHQRLISLSARKVIHLKERITLYVPQKPARHESTAFPGSSTIPGSTAIPPNLSSKLHKDKTHLVVHSGPKIEVDQLIERAKTIMESGDNLVVIAPNNFWPNLEVFSFFPASILYSSCAYLYTGSGYNTMAEIEKITSLSDHMPEHHPIAFERIYDDQQFRLETSLGISSKSTKNPPNPSMVAAEFIRAIMVE